MSWTNAVITAAGQAMQAALAGTGKGFTFTRAASGAGTAAGELSTQTALTDERQTLSLQPGETVEGNKKKIQVVLSNAGLQTGYTMHQLGFFAQAEDSEDEILYAIVQDETGDAIPSAADSPGFSVDWTYIFSYGSADEVSVTLDPAGVIGWGAVGQPGGVAPLDEGGLVPDEHLPEMDYIPMSQKGQPGGVAELGADGKVAAGQIGAAGGSLLTITFDEALEGLPYTIAGGEESYAGTVPESLTAVHSLLGINTEYTLTVQGGSKNYTRTVTTLDYFTALEVSITPFAATITVTCPAGSTVTCANDGTTLTQTATSGTAVFTVGNAGTWTVTATLDGESASGEVVISADGESKSITLQYVHIYGVLWDGTSTTALSRTDDAAGFTDPNPAVNNGNGSSPFDNLLPWSGMQRSTDPQAGELVAIPKFWYKWTKSGNSLKLQIADKAVDGFYVSPAHCDRGDGHGERDVVYVGRYHCASDYKSKTGVATKNNITRSSARSSIHNLGGTIWQWDWAMNWTIKMLYLVEYADWNSQTKIGYGCSPSNEPEVMGQTDGMTYHTGTTKANRTTYSFTQYRHIEGLWDNVYDWVDGCYYNSNGLNIILNPGSFSDSSGGTAVGVPSSGYPSALTVGEVLDNQWPLPTAASGSDSTYVPDYWNFDASNPCLRVGGDYSRSLNYGSFYVNFNAVSSANANFGCRLMKLP